MFSTDARVIVDADSLYFKMGIGIQSKFNIRIALKKAIQSIRRECMSDDLRIAVKGSNNFRYGVLPAYKSNRQPLDQELSKYITYGLEHMVGEYGAVPADGMEADDLVSIWAYEAMSEDANYVVAGIDKDLLQIPGDHYNYNKKTHQHITVDQADLNLMLQCLTGDGGDFIAGIKGIGPKKAAKILEGVEQKDRWDTVVKTWKEHDAGDPTQSWRLLRMLQSWDEFEEVSNQLDSRGKPND